MVYINTHLATLSDTPGSESKYASASLIESSASGRRSHLPQSSLIRRNAARICDDLTEASPAGTMTRRIARIGAANSKSQVLNCVFNSVYVFTAVLVEVLLERMM
jgi:hypothetical protein